MKRAIAALILVALTIPGAYGIWWRSRTGLMETDLTNHVVWGLWTSMSVYFLGLSAGGLVLSSLVYGFRVKQLERVGRLAVLQAFVCLLMGVVLIGLDLGHPLRIIIVLISPNPLSLLSWGAYLYLIYLALLALQIWILRPVTTADELPARRKHLLKVIALIGIPVAVAVQWGAGTLLAVVKARPEWNTGITPVAFLASAALSGTALLMVLAKLFDRKDEGHDRTMAFMAKLASVILIFQLLLLVSEGFVVWYAGVPGEVASLHHLLFGPYWGVFWVLHLLLGMLVPLAVFGFDRLRSNAQLAALAAVLVLLGTAGYRLNILIPAQIDAPFRELSTAFYHARNLPEYFPSAVEWLSTMGVIAGGCWLIWFGHTRLNGRGQAVAQRG